MSDRGPSPSPSTTLLRSRPIARTGAAIKSVLTVLCGGAILLTAGAVLDPASLQAKSVAPAPTPILASPAHSARSTTISHRAIPAEADRHSDSPTAAAPPALARAPAATNQLSPFRLPLTSNHDRSDASHSIPPVPPTALIESDH